jgi:hypothetical protein
MVSLIHRFARRANLSQAAMLAECPRNTSRIATSRALQRGAFRDRHERWVRDAMDAFEAQDERIVSGRRSRVVLTPRRWCQVLKKLTLLRDDGGNKARLTRESSE